MAPVSGLAVSNQDDMKTLDWLTTAVAVVLAVLLAMVHVAGAQQDTAFEVASVRRNSSAATSELRAMATLLGRFDIERVDTPDGQPAQERLAFTMSPLGLRMRLRERP